MVVNNKKNSYDNRPLGFFDSGVGGLTVLDKARKILPNEKFLYFGDTKNMPYGEKSEEQLIEFADRIFKFFEKGQDNSDCCLPSFNDKAGR